MARKLVLFGAGDIARLAHVYFTTDSKYTVVAWHPTLGRTTRRVDMPRHGDVDLALKL